MSFFENLGDWIYSKSSDELETNAAMHEQVAAGQSARYNQLEAQGKISALDNILYQQEIKNAGSMTRDYQKQTSSPLHILAGIPWWVWVIAIGAGLYYFGAFTWLTGKVSKKFA